MKYTLYFALLFACGLIFVACNTNEQTASIPPTIGSTTPEQILDGLDAAVNAKDSKSSLMSDQGCTRTYGYWKTHSIYGPASYDETWMLLPGGLGSDTPFFDLGKTWYQVLWTSPKGGDAYYILAHQFIAAALNWRAGAGVPAYVSTALQHAAVLLYTYDGTPYGQDAIIDGIRDDFMATKAILEEYNLGMSLTGPPHCEE